MKSVMIAALFFLSLAAGGQNTVEVVVTDTVQISADRFIYQLFPMPDYWMETEAVPMRPVDHARRETDMRRRQKEVMDSIEKQLLQKGFKPLPAGINDMMASRGFGNQFLRYQLSSVEELVRFQSALLQGQQVNAMLQSATSSREQEAEARLEEKLLQKARMKAARLAQLSGRKITGIVSLSDQTEGSDIPGYPGSMRMGTMATTTRTDVEVNTTYAKPGRLVVRFSWE